MRQIMLSKHKTQIAAVNKEKKVTNLFVDLKVQKPQGIITRQLRI